MRISRREFVTTGIAGFTGLCVGNCTAAKAAAKTNAQLPDEDGYKLWLRYEPPGEAVKRYRRLIRQIRVEGISAASGIIRQELSSATKSMLGSTVPLVTSGLQAGTVVV